MITTLDLPEKLLVGAMKVIHINTKTEFNIKVLGELVRKSKISGLKNIKQKLK